MDWELAIVIAVAVVVMVVAAVVGLAFMRTSGERQTLDRQRATTLGMSLGMLFGAALGTVVWVSTDQFVFWVIFMGGGMAVGLAIGSSLGSRE